ncbi:hypothetical protein K439DRAFT_1404841 [Ramaria rubella]|nr:hypothetical protein K439DRAFT_1404841 [Ramaria rubella]
MNPTPPPDDGQSHSKSDLASLHPMEGHSPPATASKSLPTIQSEDTDGSSTHDCARARINDLQTTTVSRGLAYASAVANSDPQTSQADRILERIENNITAVSNAQENAVTTMTDVKGILDSTGGTDAVTQGVNSIVESNTVFMNTLEEMSRFHPFIGVTVILFKAIWAFEMRRRDNDRKIMELHLEMRDTMDVLAQIKNITDPETVANDSTLARGRLQTLSQETVEEIKDCANTCDTYSNETILAKVLNSAAWQGRLAKYDGLFTRRRSEFDFALNVHTAVGVDTANRTLDDVKDTTLAIDEKVDVMMTVFQSIMPPKDGKKLKRLLNQTGGNKTILESKKPPREPSINNLRGELKSVSSEAVSTTENRKPVGLEEIHHNLHPKPDGAVQNNWWVIFCLLLCVFFLGVYFSSSLLSIDYSKTVQAFHRFGL